jgi:RNA recognition motif-containing protein
VSNKYTQKSKGFAFVTMLTVEEARRAVTELHDKDFMGRKLVVSGAKTSDIVRNDTRESRDPSPAQEAPREESAPTAQ